MKPTVKTKFHGLWREISYRPFHSCIHFFVAFSILWTLVEGVTYFLPNSKMEGWGPLAVIILISISFGLERVWKPSSIVIKIATTNTKIRIFFGDLFEQKGVRGIAVTEFFESELGTPVSENSLYGMFLKKHFSDNTEDFNEQVDRQLSKIFPESSKKSVGKVARYPIGTTARIDVDDDTYILFANAQADPNTCKASTDVTKMWIAMHGLWERARIESGGRPLIIPLIGGGLSGIGLHPRDLLNLIILSAITETKVKQIVEQIRIVLHPDQFDEINLRDVKTYWEES